MESTIKSTIGSRPNLSAAIFVNGESSIIIDEIDYHTQIILSFNQSTPNSLSKKLTHTEWKRKDGIEA